MPAIASRTQLRPEESPAARNVNSASANQDAVIEQRMECEDMDTCLSRWVDRHTGAVMPSLPSMGGSVPDELAAD